MKNRIVRILLILSLLFNGAVVYLDIVPTLGPKIHKKYVAAHTLENQESGIRNQDHIFSAALKMLMEEKPVTVWNEAQGFTNSILNLRSITASKSFQLDNYPRAFLILGLIKYSYEYKEKEFEQIRSYFDKAFINNSKDIVRIDEVPLGLAALELYRITGEQQYLEFSSKVYNFVLTLKDKNEIISYRKNQDSILNDAIGLSIPFLVDYSAYNANALELAKRNLAFYVEFGTNRRTHLPSHAVNKNTKTQVGSSNWGRGIGWYALGLASYHQKTGGFTEELKGLMESLSLLELESGLWSQFPGSSSQVDTSATLLFIYSALLANTDLNLTQMELINKLAPYISTEGELLQTSGDTYSANRYSTSFGKSELSQGLLLLALSLTEAK